MLGNCVITVSECNGTPGLVINTGDLGLGVNIAPNTLAPGRHTINFTFSPDSDICFYITGKDHNCDTLVDSKGNILADKYIKIELLMLEHLLFNEPELYANNFNPYFGFNEKVETFKVRPFHDWSWWYLEILEKVNKNNDLS